MEGLGSKLALAAPLQAWKSTAPALLSPSVTLRRSPLTARKQPLYPLSLAFAPFRTSYNGRLRICSAYGPLHSNSKKNVDDNEDAELKRNLARAGGLVISLAMAILSLQGFFCRPAFAARSWPETPTSTSTPEFESVKDKEEINKIFKELLQPQQGEGNSNQNPSFNPNPNSSPDLGHLPDREESLKDFQRLPLEAQQELVKRAVMAPILAGNIEMAVEMLDAVIQKMPDDVEWRLMKAYILDDSDRVAEAKTTFEEILQIQPYNAHALQGVAIVMHKFGEDVAMIEKVEELVKKAQEQEQEGVAYNMKLVLAHVYIVQDNIEGALKQYQHLIDENPQDFRPYLCQGIIYSVLNKKDEAKERFEKYSKLVPESFSQHEFIDEVLLKVQTESAKLAQARKKQQKLLEEGSSPDKVKQSGKRMKQPRFR